MDADQEERDLLVVKKKLKATLKDFRRDDGAMFRMLARHRNANSDPVTITYRETE